MADKLEAALHYAEALGIPVLPLKPRDKVPVIKDWVHNASTEPEQIRKWWAVNPERNVGGLMGEVVCLDFDVDDGGAYDSREWLRDWEAENGALPETATAVTGRGGTHLFYRVDRPVTKSENGELHIDIRGLGSQAMLAPSVHPNGNEVYWDLDPDEYGIAQANELVYRLIDDVRPKSKENGGRSAKVQMPSDKVGAGEGRNNFLYEQGCSARAKGFGDADIAEWLAHMNRSKCDPPLGSAELRKIVHSVCELPIGLSPEAKVVKAQAKKANGGNRRFDHAAIGDALMSECGACFVDGMPAIRTGDVFAIGWNAVDAEIIKRVKSATRANQNEVHHYLAVMAGKVSQSPPNLIAFTNGVLDIETMELRGWLPSDVIPNVVPHEWNPGAECPEVDTILLKMAAGDPDIYQNLMEVMGCCIYRSAEFGQSAILLGSGSNGKSTYIQMLLAMLGTENVSSLDMGMIGKQFHTGRLVGKLANLGDDISNEFQHGDLLSIFKKVVTGNRLYADVKGTEGFEFSPYCQMVFSANEFPRLADYTDGMMRRIFPIEFNAVFRRTDPDYDPRISKKVTTETACQRMCVLAVYALRNVIAQNGFTPNAASQRRVDEIRADNDTVLAWALEGEWCADSLSEMSIADYYDAYREWTRECGLQAVKRTKFTRSINAQFGLEVRQKFVNGKTVRAFAKA